MNEEVETMAAQFELCIERVNIPLRIRLREERESPRTLVAAASSRVSERDSDNDTECVQLREGGRFGESVFVSERK